MIGGFFALDLIRGEICSDDHGVGDLGHSWDRLWAIKTVEGDRVGWRGRVRGGTDVDAAGESGSRKYAELRSVCETMTGAGVDEFVVSVGHVIALIS